MKRFGIVSLLVAVSMPSCFVYNPDLLDEADGAGTGSATAGDGDGNGGSVIMPGAGGSGAGGTGSSDGGGSGGDNPGAGGMGGGDGGGDGGTTGGGGTTGDGDLTLVDDMESGPSFVNLPFSGTWNRYDQGSETACNDAVWASATVADMFVDDGGDQVLEVSASDLDCWGVDLAVTLNGADNTVDLSEYTGVMFSARRIGTESALTLRMEDDISRDATCDEFCYDHAESSFKPSLTTEWKEFKVPFVVFTRTPAFDITTAHAIHFAMDPMGDTVHFQLDDIYLYIE